MINPFNWVSRVAHLLSASYLIGGTLYPLLVPAPFEDIPQPSSASFMYAVVGLIVSGLYNAGAAKPSAMNPGTAGLWRMVVYGLKLSMVAACSPMLDKVVEDPKSKAWARFAALTLALGAGSFARFYREANMPGAKEL